MDRRNIEARQMDASRHVQQAQGDLPYSSERYDSGYGIAGLSNLNENPFDQLVRMPASRVFDRGLLGVKKDELKSTYRHKKRELKYRSNIPREVLRYEKNILKMQYKIAKERLRSLYKLT